MLGRLLDDSFPDEVRANVTILTAGRMAANSAYRFAGPFLGTIAAGLDVSLPKIGIALAVAELSGLLGPFTGRLVDRLGPRRAMVAGLSGVTAGAVLAGSAGHVATFGAALFLLSWSYSMYSIGLGSWIAGHVDYARRSRVVGLTETSWAFALLVGVSLMGLITGWSSWRVAYVAVAAAAMAMALNVRIRLAPEQRPAPTSTVGAVGKVGRSGALAMIGMFGLSSAAQTLFVTFGSWLKDDHGFSATKLAAVTFGLGAFELGASLTSAHRTDQWGKERSVAGAAAMMVPATVVLAVAHHTLAVGLAATVVGITMFEFAIVSAMAIGSVLVRGSAARGLALVISSATVGRSAASMPATKLYDRFGIAAPAVMAAGLACLTVVCFSARARAERLAQR